MADYKASIPHNNEGEVSYGIGFVRHKNFDNIITAKELLYSWRFNINHILGVY